MTSTLLQSYAVNNILVIKICVQSLIFDVHMYAHTVIYLNHVNIT